MSLQVEKLEHNMAKLTIEVEAEELEKALQSVYLKERKKFSFPGFRKGKVPRQMIEKVYGPEIFYEDAAQKLVSEAYGEAYDESGLFIVSRPNIELVQIEKGKPFIFTAEVAVRPEVILGEYKGAKVEKIPVEEVTEEEVNAEIEKEIQRNARIVEVTDRAVQDKDMITLDYEGFVDGVPFEGGKSVNYALTIGSGTFIPGFEEQLIGTELEKQTEVKVTFPEEYHAPELAGKQAVFVCTVHKIEEKQLPEADDEFASEVSEFETLAEYKADIEKKLKDRKEAEARTKREDLAVDKAVETAVIDIPQLMIDTQAEQLADDFAQRLQNQGLELDKYFEYTGMTREKMMEEFNTQAEKRIRTRLVLEEVVKAENITVSEERVEEELGKMAASYNMEIDKIKEFITEKEREQVKEDLAVQDAVTFLADMAVEE